MRRTLLLTTAALTAASCGRLPVPGDTSTPQAITGQVRTASLPSTLTYRSGVDGSETSANVGADGQFTLGLTLPSEGLTEPETLLALIGCTGTVTTSSADARGAAIFALHDERGVSYVAGEGRARAVPPGADVNVQGFVYSDRAVSITGTLDCRDVIRSPLAIPTQVSLVAAKGWNRVTLAISSDLGVGGAKMSARLSTGGSPLTVWRTAQDLQGDLRLF